MNWLNSLPLIIFYITLLVNTYFSVKLFSKILKRWDIINLFIDAILLFLYLALAWFLNNQQMFLAVVCLMFAVATSKYVSMLAQKKYSSYAKTIRRKIILDSIGFFYSVIAFGAIAHIGITASVWIWTAGFVIANIYLLRIKPFYVIYN